METKKVLTREDSPTDELQGIVNKVYRGLNLQYNEMYYLDYTVDEETGLISKDVQEKHYTKNQMEQNIKALKNAYHIAKGSASPSEIINFRRKYDISASTFSVILGFSKNTVSNIENEGITSLTSGRLIKICLDNTDILDQYVQLCDEIDDDKKQKISKRLREIC